MSSKSTGNWQILIVFYIILQILYLQKAGAAIQTLKSSITGIKHQIIDFKNSVDFFVNYNDEGIADAFVYTFEIKDFNQTTNTVETYRLVDYMTKNQRFIYNETKNCEYTEVEKIDGILPICYAQTPGSEFENVQSLIDRLEEILSKNADSNNYFADPILVAIGRVINNNAKQGETGNIIEIDSQNGNGKLDYLTWERASESFTFEVENLLKHIYSLSQTPQVDFETLKSVGTLSGVALELIFLGTTIKTKDHKHRTFNKLVGDLIENVKNQLTFNESVKGDFNTLEIGYKFNDGLPVDEAGLVESLSVAVNSSFLSKETATELNPYVFNSTSEVEKLKNESTEGLSVE